MVDLRLKVKDLIYHEITENIVNSLTSSKLDQTGSEMMFALNTANSSPLGFINKSNEMASILFTDIDIRKNNSSLFINNYINNFFTEGEKLSLSNVNLEIDSLSKDISEMIQKSISINSNKLYESFEPMNENEIDSIINTKRIDLLKKIELTLVKLDLFKSQYLKENKYIIKLNKHEKESFNIIVKNINKCIDELKNCKSSINKYNKEFLKDENKKYEIVNTFNAINICISLSVVLMLNTRILFGNNTVNVNDKAISYSYDLSKLNNNNFVPFEILTKLSTSINSDINLYFIDFLTKNINPRYTEILKYFFNTHPSDSVQGSDISNIFVKKSAISIKYLHHIDNLFRSAEDLLDSFDSFFNSFKLKSINDILNGSDIISIKDNINKCVNSSSIFKNDVISYLIGGSANAKNKMLDIIASNPEEAHSKWDIGSHNQIENNSVYGSKI